MDQVLYSLWDEKVRQLFQCKKSDLVFSTAITTNFQKTLKCSNARAKHTYIVSKH